MKRFKNGCDMGEFGSRDDSACERVLNALEAVKLIFRKFMIKRVAVI